MKCMFFCSVWNCTCFNICDDRKAIETRKRQIVGLKASLTNFGEFLNENIRDEEVSNIISVELENHLSNIEATLLPKFSWIQDNIDIILTKIFCV